MGPFLFTQIKKNFKLGLSLCCVITGRAAWALTLFFVVQLRRPALRVISQPSCVAKSATSLVCLVPVRATWALPLFSLSSSSAHPSSRFSLFSNGKERHYRQGFQRLSGLHGHFRFSLNKVLFVRLADWICVALVFSGRGIFVMPLIQFD